MPTFSKILEKVVDYRLISHVLNFNVLSDFQSGFRISHSTQDVLLHVVDCWHRTNDGGKFVVAGFLDLAKAFHCVHHGILLFKLEQYGIVGSTYSWFEEYLFSRQQFVSFQGCLCEWCTVSVGVPQGSIFGPLLYSVYVNDLPTVVRHSQVNMYIC